MGRSSRAPHLALSAGFVVLVLSGCAGEPGGEGEGEREGAPAPRPALFSDTTRGARIVARAIEAHGGWERWAEVRDLTVYDTRRGFGADGDTTETRIVAAYHKGPPWMRIERRSRDGDTVVHGYDGETHWASRNGERLHDPEAVAQARFRVWTDQYFHFLPFKLADEGARFEYRGRGEVEGRPVDRVRVTYGSGIGDAPDDVYTYAFDAETHTLVSFHFNVTAVDPDFYELVRWVETDWMHGLLRPRRTKAWDSDASRAPVRQRSEHAYDSIQVNRGLDRAYFRPPGPSDASGMSGSG